MDFATALACLREKRAVKPIDAIRACQAVAAGLTARGAPEAAVGASFDLGEGICAVLQKHADKPACVVAALKVLSLLRTHNRGPATSRLAAAVVAALRRDADNVDVFIAGCQAIECMGHSNCVVDAWDALSLPRVLLAALSRYESRFEPAFAAVTALAKLAARSESMKQVPSLPQACVVLAAATRHVKDRAMAEAGLHFVSDFTHFSSCKVAASDRDLAALGDDRTRWATDAATFWALAVRQHCTGGVTCGSVAIAASTVLANHMPPDRPDARVRCLQRAMLEAGAIEVVAALLHHWPAGSTEPADMYAVLVMVKGLVTLSTSQCMPGALSAAVKQGVLAAVEMGVRKAPGNTDVAARACNLLQMYCDEWADAEAALLPSADSSAVALVSTLLRINGNDETICSDTLGIVERLVAAGRLHAPLSDPDVIANILSASEKSSNTELRGFSDFCQLVNAAGSVPSLLQALADGGAAATCLTGLQRCDTAAHQSVAARATHALATLLPQTDLSATTAATCAAALVEAHSRYSFEWERFADAASLAFRALSEKQAACESCTAVDIGVPEALIDIVRLNLGVPQIVQQACCALQNLHAGQISLAQHAGKSGAPVDAPARAAASGIRRPAWASAAAVQPPVAERAITGLLAVTAEYCEARKQLREGVVGVVSKLSPTAAVRRSLRTPAAQRAAVESMVLVMDAIDALAADAAAWHVSADKWMGEGHLRGIARLISDRSTTDELAAAGVRCLAGLVLKADSAKLALMALQLPHAVLAQQFIGMHCPPALATAGHSLLSALLDPDLQRALAVAADVCSSFHVRRRLVSAETVLSDTAAAGGHTVLTLSTDASAVGSCSTVAAPIEPSAMQSATASGVGCASSAVDAAATCPPESAAGESPASALIFALRVSPAAGSVVPSLLALSAAAALAGQPEERMSELLDGSGPCRIVVAVMQLHGVSETVALCGCRLLREMAAVPGNRALLVDGGAVPALVQALTEHADDKAVCREACGALRNIGASPEWRTLLAGAGAVPVVMEALVRNLGYNTDAVFAACGALFALACEPANHSLLIEARAADVMVTAARAHEGEACVLWVSCGFWEKLLRSARGRPLPAQLEARALAMAAVVADALDRHAGDTRICATASAVARLLHDTEQ